MTKREQVLRTLNEMSRHKNTSPGKREARHNWNQKLYDGEFPPGSRLINQIFRYLEIKGKKEV